MTTETASRFPSLGRSTLTRVKEFLTTPSLARSMAILLSGAILLLLVVNLSTFVMIQRTATYNDQVDATWQMRRAARNLILNVQGAETSQRGYLLTGQAASLVAYEEARAANPDLMTNFELKADGDATSLAFGRRLKGLAESKFAEMSSILALARQGRNAEALAQVRAGRGQTIMDELRREMADLDGHINSLLDDRTARSEQAAVVTATINAIAGSIILILAGIMAMLVRRYLGELKSAHDELDRVNAGLEETVRVRTAALSRANEEVQRFAYIVSHDLRAPLVNVMGFTAELEQAGVIIDRQIGRLETVVPDLIESDAVTAVRSDIPEAIGFIRASTEKMDRLINAILKLSREGRRNLQAEPLDMNAMVRRAADSIHHQTEGAGAEVAVESLPQIESDRLSMEQIIGNLIDNAVKYLDPKRPGRIVVSGQEVAGGWVEYAIADNGRGISDKDHERIFELFRRSGRQDRPGEGLGLAFVRNSVRRLGGSITVESVLGEGSTFRLKFPKRLILVEDGDAA